MIVSVHQPHYLPWCGYFDKIDCADVFVLLDTVQFEKNGWQNRNRIKTPSGWMWMTVPVKHRFGASLAETVIDGRSPWTRKHRNTLAAFYAKAPFYASYSGFFDEVYDREWSALRDLNSHTLSFLLRELGITTKVVWASALGNLPVEPNERLAAIVRKCGGDTYLAGSGCSGYFAQEPFDREGVKALFQEYRPARYPQLHGEFEPGLSAVDLLLNCGDNSLDILRKGRRTVL